MTNDFSAVNNGIVDATPVLQEALNQKGELRIPAGKYLLKKSLLVYSDTKVTAEPGATFHFADKAGAHGRSFMITNANPGNGNTNIFLEGGLWDANSAGNPRGKDGWSFKNAGKLIEEGAAPSPYTGVAINFVNVSNLTIRNLTVHNPETFFIRIGEVRGFLVENITLSADNIRLNNDGVHVGGFSEHGIIRNIRAAGAGVPNDDMVALNADDDVERQANFGMRRGPIRDILVEDITAEDAYTFIRLFSVNQPIEDITIRRLSGSCRKRGINMDSWIFPKGSGEIKRVTLEDIHISKTEFPKQYPSIIHINLKVDDLIIRKFCRGSSTLSEVKTLIIDNNQDLTLLRDGKAGSINAAEGFTDHKSDIGELLLNNR
jgi:polygalacturonase